MRIDYRLGVSKPRCSISELDAAISIAAIVSTCLMTRNIGESYGIEVLNRKNCAPELSSQLPSSAHTGPMLNASWSDLDNNDSGVLLDKYYCGAVFWKKLQSFPPNYDLYRLCGDDWMVLFNFKSNYKNQSTWQADGVLPDFDLVDVTFHGDFLSFTNAMLMYKLNGICDI